jgi:peptidoglycan biosynthesis protein MviN/MurJ (putative lipid II flippase)
MRASVATVVLNMLLYLPLIRVFGFAGLAAATSVAGLVNFLALMYFLPRKGVAYDPAGLMLDFVRMALAAFGAVLVAGLLPLEVTDTGSEILTRALNVVIDLAAAGVIYLLACFVLRVRELSLLLQRMRRILTRR